MKQIIFILFFVVSLVAYSQPPKKFFSTYGGNGYDVGYDIKQTLDKGYIITGSTSSFGKGNTDLYLLKLDSMGQKKFETSFGGLSNEIGKGVIQLSDSSYVMVGYTSSFGTGGYDIFLLNADKNGNLIWQKTLGGNDWDFAYDIQQTTDGGFIITGTTYSFGYGNADGYIIKTDVQGNVIWSKVYGGKKDDEFKSVTLTSDGNYALTGYTKSYNDSLGDAWVFKIDVNGDSLWSKYYGGNKEDFANQIIENNSGEFFIAGSTASSGAGLLDAYGFKINSSGALSSTFIIDGSSSNNEIYTSVAISKRNGINIVCFSEKETFPGFKLQIKVIEFTFGLLYINATDYGSNIDDETYKLIATKDKGYAIIGHTYGYNAKLTDVYIAKMDSNLVGGNYSIVSVNEITKKDINLNIYPNPAHNSINLITSIYIENKDIKLYDLIGKEITLNNKLIDIEPGHKMLNVEDLNNGIYYLKILNKTERISVIH